MKKYDRETGKWLDEKEVDRKLAKRKLCVGGREHDYILVLPYYARTDNSVLGIEVAERFYAIEDEYYKALEPITQKHDESLKKLGITFSASPYNRGRSREYMCSICKKRHYEYLKTLT